MKYLKSYIIAVSMVLVFSLSASAFAPLVYLGYVVGTELAPYAAASVALHVTAAAAGLYYYMKGSAASSVTATGGVTKPSEAQWIDLTATPPAVKTKSITAGIPFQKVKDISSANPAKYPRLNDAGTVSNVWVAVLPDASKGEHQYLPPVGSIIRTAAGGAGVNHVVSSVTVGSYGDGGAYIEWFEDHVTMFSGSVYPVLAPRYQVYFDVSAMPIPTMSPATNADIAKKISSTSDGNGSVTSDYQSEIDKMLQEPSYVPTFTDDTTGLPFVPPPASQVATPAQVAAYNNTGRAGAAAAASTAASTAAAATAAAGAAAAGAAYDAATAAAAAAGGTNAGLNAAAAAAGVAVGAANTAAGNAAAAAAATAAEDAKNAAQTSAGIPAAPVRKTIDFEPLKVLNGALQTTYPFNLPSSVSSYFSAFSGGNSSAPVFDLPLPLGQTIHVDLSFFDGLATMIRFMIGISVSGGILFYIIHFFRGIS